MSGEMDAFETITCAVDGPVATVTLNRPEARNALSMAMVEELLRCFTALREDACRDVRVVVLRAAGETFCAGGDLRDMSAASEDGAGIGSQLDDLLRAVNEAPQVVVARIQGAAMGGGLGLVCVSDIAIADEGATFGLPEVRLGIAPAIISPYVIERIGFTRARQLVLTGRRFGAASALEYGLIHEVAVVGQLDAQVEATVVDVLKCAPNALRECKRLLFVVLTQPDSLEDRVATLRPPTHERGGRRGHTGVHPEKNTRRGYPTHDQDRLTTNCAGDADAISSACLRSCHAAYDSQGPDRQSRRDRLSHHADLPQHGDRHRRGVFRCRRQRAPCARGRRGGSYRRERRQRIVSQYPGADRRCETHWRRRGPSRLWLSG